MPVDPEIKNIIDQLAQYRPESTEGLTPARLREISASYGQMISSPPIKDTEDFGIPVEDGEIGARLYVPDNDTDALIIYFHGGGFVIGDIDSHDGICRMLSRHSGCRIVSVDYRLAPENKFPTAVNDAFYAYRWIRDHADRFGVNPGKIAVSGDSAGGNLCATLSLKAIDEEYPVPAMLIMYYPVVAPDTASQSFREYSRGYYLTAEYMFWFNQHYSRGPEDMLHPYFSPALSPNIGKLPETLVVTAEYDPLRDQGETFVSTLTEKGVKATGIRAEGMVHGFLSFFPASHNARSILSMTASFAGSRLSSMEIE